MEEKNIIQIELPDGMHIELDEELSLEIVEMAEKDGMSVEDKFNELLDISLRKLTEEEWRWARLMKELKGLECRFTQNFTTLESQRNRV